MKKYLTLPQIKEELVNVEIELPYYFETIDIDDEDFKVGAYFKLEDDCCTIIKEVIDEHGDLEYTIAFENIDSIEDSGYDHFIIESENHRISEEEFDEVKERALEFVNDILDD